MATINADIKRLFISTAAFIAGSIKGQLGFDKTAKIMNLHNDTDDTIVMSWSDDTKQTLLAGTQTVTGDKTFSGTTTFTGPVVGDIVTLSTVQTITGVKTVEADFVMGDGNILKLNDVGDLTTANIYNDGGVLKANNVTAISINPTGAGSAFIGGVTTEIYGQNAIYGSTAGTTEIIATGGLAKIQSTTGNVEVNAFAIVAIDGVDIVAAGTTSVLLDANAGATKANLTTFIELTSPAAVDIEFDTNAPGTITITNNDDTDTSTVNGLEIIGSFTQDLSAGGAVLQALDIAVAKDGAWSTDQEETSKITIKKRSWDSTNPSVMQEVFKASGYNNITIGDDTGVSYINVGTSDVNIFAGDSNNGLTVTIAGTERLRLFEGESSKLFQETLEVDVGKIILKSNSTLEVAPISLGMIQYIGKAFFGVPSVDNYGSIPAFHTRRSIAHENYVNDTVTTQQWFGTDGAITIASDTAYKIYGRLILDCGAGNHLVQLGFGGTATLTSITYLAVNTVGAALTPSTTIYNTRIHQSALTDTQAAGTADNTVEISGIIRVNAGGTFIPQFKFTTGAPGAGTINLNTMFELSPMCAGDTTSVGKWS